MKIRVREAKPRDRGLFRKLWKEYLKDQVKKGGDILPTKNNLDKFEMIFDKYVNKELPGVVLFVADHAVAMFGSRGEEVFDINIEKPAQGWGTYVKPEARRHNIGTKIREVAVEKLRELGFKNIIGSYFVGNEEGRESLKEFDTKKHSIVVVSPIDEKQESTEELPELNEKDFIGK